MMTNQEQSLKERFNDAIVRSVWLNEFIYLFESQMCQSELPILVIGDLEILHWALKVFVLEYLSQ